MNIKIIENSAFPSVAVDLGLREQIIIERGSMIYHNGEVELKGTINSNGQKGIGGMIRALGRSVSSGESIFCTTVTGKTDTAKIGFAPTLPGEIKILNIGEQQWRLNTSSFLACESGVSYNMQKQSIKSGLFGSGGFFVMQTQGKGKLLINSYGSVVKIHLTDEKPFIIDNNHVLAWSTTLDYKVKMGSKLLGFTTGEGLVNEFYGQGTILVQTRTIQGFAGLLSPYILNNSEMEKDFDSF
ncbi:TIGR00266 family protein [Enterococcus plantarum]|uniref:TIGR00266 family protein n=1 Tax=Enterococcus plantarum TaxID=1077675 RepID=UPI001A8F5476|nr:TIGR00266 family protein [Enterococcus plantarum]MBO0422197.1 TIGR00266 family protein [Enterococcus plantarum]